MAFLFCKCLRFKLELVNESDGDISQGVHDVFGGGGQAAGKGTHEIVVVMDGMVAQHGEGEQVELGFQGNTAVQLIGQDRQNHHAPGRRTRFRQQEAILRITSVLCKTQLWIRFRP